MSVEREKRVRREKILAHSQSNCIEAIFESAFDLNLKKPLRKIEKVNSFKNQ